VLLIQVDESKVSFPMTNMTEFNGTDMQMVSYQ